MAKGWGARASREQSRNMETRCAGVKTGNQDKRGQPEGVRGTKIRERVRGGSGEGLWRGNKKGSRMETRKRVWWEWERGREEQGVGGNQG